MSLLQRVLVGLSPPYDCGWVGDVSRVVADVIRTVVDVIRCVVNAMSGVDDAIEEVADAYGQIADAIGGVDDVTGQVADVFGEVGDVIAGVFELACRGLHPKGCCPHGSGGRVGLGEALPKWRSRRLGGPMDRTAMCRWRP